MFDLKKTKPSISAQKAIRFLNDAELWSIAFIDSNVLRQRIIDLIQDDQLFAKGIDGDGENIGFYSLTTSFINPAKEFNSHYTLKDSGAFYASMFVRVLSDSIIITANSQKLESQEWWREDILNLTEENLDKIRDDYLQIARDYARRVLA